MKLDSQQKKIVKELSLKYNLPIKKVQEIIESPFIFIRKEIQSIDITGDENKEEFENKIINFNIPCIGKLYGNYYSFKYINDARKSRNKKR